MIQTNCKIILLDVETIQDDETGERTKSIVRRTTILGQKEEVGMNTYWSATANNIKLDCSFTIRRKSYHKEKYLYSSKCLYEIHNTAKAKTPDLIRLNSKLLKDDLSEEMIEDALGTV